MLYSCQCELKSYYSSDESMAFFQNNEWYISHYPKFGIKILVCPICSSRWEYKYTENGFSIKKKKRDHRLTQGLSISLWIGETDINIKFSNAKFIRVYDNDITAIIEIPQVWVYGRDEIRYFFIKLRGPEYLSDILTMKTLGGNVGYSSNPSINIDTAKEEDFIFMWLGSVST
jgi:hypothetical protein